MCEVKTHKKDYVVITQIVNKFFESPKDSAPTVGEKKWSLQIERTRRGVTVRLGCYIKRYEA